MNFKRHTGEADVLGYKKKASTAFEAGQLVVTDANGLLVPADASATPETVVGIIMRNVTSADDDYAQANTVEVEVPRTGTEYLAKIGNGTLSQSHAGKRFDLDANGQVDLANNTNKVVEVVRVPQDTDYAIVRIVEG